MKTAIDSQCSALEGLRVCLLAGTLGQGGAERQLFHIASTLKHSGTGVIVMSLTQGEFWESKLQAVGIPVTFVGRSRSRVQRLVAITRELRAFRPDVVQSQHFFTSGYSGIAARLIGARAIGAIRGSGRADLQSCGKWLAKASVKLPHLLAANSRAAVRVLVAQGCPQNKLHFLPNVIDLDHFCPVARKNGQPLVIVGVGRLSAEKRFDRFLRVLALLKDSASVPFRAVIAGDGPLRGELEHQARATGLYPDMVQFCGSVNEINVLYREADVLLLTSEREGTPNVIMEAMASGVPVVATAVGGVTDLIQSGVTGFLSNPSDEQGLAEAVGKLLNDEGLRVEVSRRARVFIEAQHALNSLPHHLEALYGRVLPLARDKIQRVEAQAV